MSRHNNFMFKKLEDLLANQINMKPSSNDTQSRKKVRLPHQHPSFDFLALINAWEEIVGKRLAEYTIPLKNTQGTLTILTDHPAYSQQLSFMESNLKEKIFKTFPQLSSQIQRLTFQTSTVYFEQKKNDLLKAAAKRPQKNNPTLKKKQNTQYHQYDPHYKKLLKEAKTKFSDIQNQELKDQLISLYLQSKEDI